MRRFPSPREAEVEQRAEERARNRSTVRPGFRTSPATPILTRSSVHEITYASARPEALVTAEGVASRTQQGGSPHCGAAATVGIVKEMAEAGVSGSSCSPGARQRASAGRA